MRINHNIAALNTYRQLGAASNAASKNMSKLSSGMRINSAADDAAGLGISEKMRAQIRGLDQASRNAQDGISMLQTAEGALNETHAALQRMRELGVQASNDTLSSNDRAEVQKEFDQLVEQINSIANDTQFNGRNLLTGEIGVRTSDAQNITKLSMTSDTQAGTLTFTANGTMAKAATGELAIAVGATVASADGSLDITCNGRTYNVAYTTGQTYEDIASQITNTVDDLTATWDSANTKFTFTTDEANADQAFTIAEAAASASTLDGATDFSDIAVGGIDTANTVNGTASANATGLAGTVGGVAASFSYYGNEVTITSGDLKGLKLTLQADEGSTATATVNTSTITVSDQLTMQTGSNEGQNMSININAMDATSLNVGSLNLSTSTGASSAITKIDDAIDTVISERSKLGAYQNRLEYTINNLGSASENITAAESRIRDVDMAKEMMEFTKNNILNQAAQAMLAQANQQPQQVLQLLR